MAMLNNQMAICSPKKFNEIPIFADNQSCHWFRRRWPQSEGPEMACQCCAAQRSCNTSRGREFNPLQRCHQQLWEVDTMGACSLGDFGELLILARNVLWTSLNDSTFSCFGWTPIISSIWDYFDVFRQVQTLTGTTLFWNQRCVPYYFHARRNPWLRLCMRFSNSRIQLEATRRSLGNDEKSLGKARLSGEKHEKTRKRRRK